VVWVEPCPAVADQCRSYNLQGGGLPRVNQDGVQAQTTTAGGPLPAMRMIPKALHELETSTTVAAAEKRGGLHPGVDDVGVAGRARRQLPDTHDAGSCTLREGNRSLVLLGPGGPSVVGSAQGRPPVKAHRGHEPRRVSGVPPGVDQRGVHVLAGGQRTTLGEAPAALAAEHEEALCRADQRGGRQSARILRRRRRSGFWEAPITESGAHSAPTDPGRARGNLLSTGRCTSFHAQTFRGHGEDLDGLGVKLRQERTHRPRCVSPARQSTMATSGMGIQPPNWGEIPPRPGPWAPGRHVHRKA